MSLKLITAATKNPVTRAEQKLHSRIPGTADDTLVDALITAATAYTEKVLGRPIVSQTWDLFMDRFPYADTIKIEVPLPPLLSVSYVKYWDVSDVLQTWDASKYVVDNNDEDDRATLFPAINQSYPSTRAFPNAVEVRFIAGYWDTSTSPDTDSTPQAIKQAIMLLVAHLYENREATTQRFEITETPMGYEALLAPYKLQGF